MFNNLVGDVLKANIHLNSRDGHQFLTLCSNCSKLFLSSEMYLVLFM